MIFEHLVEFKLVSLVSINFQNDFSFVLLKEDWYY